MNGSSETRDGGSKHHDELLLIVLDRHIVGIHALSHGGGAPEPGISRLGTVELSFPNYFSREVSCTRLGVVAKKEPHFSFPYIGKAPVEPTKKAEKRKRKVKADGRRTASRVYDDRVGRD